MTDAPERIWAMAPHIGEYLAEPPVSPVDHLYLTEYVRADLSPAAVAGWRDEILQHLDLSQNHEAGLIPVATQILLQKIADAAPGEQPATEQPDAAQDAARDAHDIIQGVMWRLMGKPVSADQAIRAVHHAYDQDIAAALRALEGGES